MLGLGSLLIRKVGVASRLVTAHGCPQSTDNEIVKGIFADAKQKGKAGLVADFWIGIHFQNRAGRCA